MGDNGEQSDGKVAGLEPLLDVFRTPGAHCSWSVDCHTPQELSQADAVPRKVPALSPKLRDRGLDPFSPRHRLFNGTIAAGGGGCQVVWGLGPVACVPAPGGF